MGVGVEPIYPASNGSSVSRVRGGTFGGNANVTNRYKTNIYILCSMVLAPPISLLAIPKPRLAVFVVCLPAE